ncbi:MAG: YihY/virulence factor BrkB family protein [Cytophagaceae bacterium]
MKENSFSIKHLPSLLKETFIEWMDDDPFDQSAIVAFYSIFSLPALLIIIVTVAGLAFGEHAVEGTISKEVGSVMGEDAGKEIETMLANAYQSDRSLVMTIIGIATLLFGATSVLVALKRSLNRMWEVEEDTEKVGFRKVVLDRTMSFGIILVVGFLLLISLVLTSALSVLSDWIQQQLPDFLLYVFYFLNFLITLGLVTVMFALLFKFLPDVKIQWRSVWVGGVVTALLFVIGKFAMGIYFSKAEPGSTYGAAGSIILILLWVSYSCMIMFFGAEFTQVYARRYAHTIQPSELARRSYDYHEDKRKGIKPGE